MTLSKKFILGLSGAAVILSLATNTHPHSRYILPSHTSLSGEEAEPVSFDLSITNDFFHPDRAYGGRSAGAERPQAGGPGGGPGGNNPMMALMMSTKVIITKPDGTIEDAPDLTNLGRKSVTSASLDQNGTYKMTVTANPMEMTIYTKADGTRARAFGPKQDARLPEGATKVTGYRTGNRVETFVTRNDITYEAIKPRGIGLELGNGTHPNDLFVGEEIELQFLMNGRPVAEGTEVMIVLGGTRHRNDRAELQPVTDAEGRIRFEFPEAGFYFLELSAETEVEGKSYDIESYTYSASLEVWPE